MSLSSCIAAIATHLPEYVLTNEELAREYPDWDVDKIYEKTGIHTRAIVAPHETAADLGIAAATKLFQQGVCSPCEIDYLLYCTQSPDYFLPTTACIMQSRLGLPTSCGALDFNLGCSGFVYGLSLAKGLIETHQANRILLVTAETYSRYIHPDDRSVRTLFSDGAAATLITASDAPVPEIGPFIFGTDGQGAKHLIMPGGAQRARIGTAISTARISPSGEPITDDYLFMDGPEIFSFTLTAVPKMIHAILEHALLTLDDIDYIIFHQANKFILDALRKKLKLPEEKYCINMDTYGNTVSSTIPMALAKAKQEGIIKSGQRILLAGFGVGYSWAATIITLR